MASLKLVVRALVVLTAPLLTTSVGAAQNSGSFVSVTPCRVVDTRNAAGTFGGPIMAAATSRSFPLPSSSCGLPSNASAYSLNITTVPSGPLNFLTIWPTGSSIPLASTMNNIVGTVLANAAIVPAGTGGAISVYVTDATHVIIDVDGYFAPNTNSAVSNTGLGPSSLSLTAGAQNTALGFSALGNNATGNFNTAMGSNTLSSNSSGSNNTAVGASSLVASTTGQSNTAIGVQALFSSTGDSNIAIGYQAGSGVGAGANNVDIANVGGAGDNGAMRIGTPGLQNFTFIAGITGVNVGSGANVVINSSGELGTVLSSRRYKQDIQPMADASDRLMQLQPVTFRYKQPAPDGTRDLQYGLVAEQVAAIYPELAVYNKDGQVETLQYHQLPAMLLNEIQKQRKTIEDMETRIAVLEQQLLKAGAAH